MQYTIEQGWITNIRQVKSPFYDERPDNTKISLLVIHNISLPPGEYGGQYVEDLFTGMLDPTAHDYFQDIYQLKVSSHLFIRRDGEMIQFVPLDKRAWHAGQSHFKGIDKCNDFSIGIELEGSDHTDFTAEQYAQLITITNLLQQAYPINDIMGHSDIAPARKTDPGPCFDWCRYFLALANTLSDDQYRKALSYQLNKIKKEMQESHCWETAPPSAKAYLSQQPFFLDTMPENQWLQWVFLLNMQSLIDKNQSLPSKFALFPYFEEALKNQKHADELLRMIKQLDMLAEKRHQSI